MFQVGRVNVAGTDAESCCTPTDTSCCTGVAGCQPGDNSQCGMNGMTGFVDVDFHTEFPDDEVSVLPQVQTYNDPSFVKARMAPRENVSGSAACPPTSPVPDPALYAVVRPAQDHSESRYQSYRAVDTVRLLRLVWMRGDSQVQQSGVAR
eukprot:COSAG05_NODE_12891_length_450_cov_1.031339_1_plen_149_part_11